MSAVEAVDYGMVDAVLQRAALVPVPTPQEAIQ